MDTAEEILRRAGLATLNLKAIAREVGVSHGSPAHHFQNLGGLLSDLAAMALRRLATILRNGSAIRRPTVIDGGAQGRVDILAQVYAMVVMSPPSTRKAAPLVAEARGLAR